MPLDFDDTFDIKDRARLAVGSVRAELTRQGITPDLDDDPTVVGFYKAWQLAGCPAI